jgi:serine/threonine protein kinase
VNRNDASNGADSGASGLIADRYEIRQSIGSGGAGAVFKAWDTQLNRPVAVKRWNAPEPMLDDREGTERLWREAMTLAAIQHPNILTIHDFGVDDEGPYVITEFVDGETLDRAVEREPFDREAFAEAAQQILEGLIAAHQAGLIHRDLKPQNIMRTRLPSGAWQYKILDFGLARFVTRPTVQSLEGNTSIYGSILYIAPEQLRHQPLDVRTDIYAFGCLCYYMLAGRNAIDGDTIPDLIARHLEHAVKPLAEWRPDLPAGLCEWVMKALSFDPADRFPSAAAALAALGQALPGSIRKTTVRIPLPGQAPPPPPPAAPPPRPAAPAQGPAKAAAAPSAWIAGRRRRRAPAGGRRDRRAGLARRAATAATTTPSAMSRSSRIAHRRQSWNLSSRVWRATLPRNAARWSSTTSNSSATWSSTSGADVGYVLEALAQMSVDARLDPEEIHHALHLTYHDTACVRWGERMCDLEQVEKPRRNAFEAAVSTRFTARRPVRNQIARFGRALEKGEVFASSVPPTTPGP